MVTSPPQCVPLGRAARVADALGLALAFAGQRCPRRAAAAAAAGLAAAAATAGRLPAPLSSSSSKEEEERG